MSDRQPRTVRVSDETWDAFVKQVVEWEGQKHGEIGRHAEKALEEYIDHGRLARIEEKLDEVVGAVTDDGTTRTHTSPGTGTTSEKTRAIFQRLRDNHGAVISASDVDRAIEDYAGGDPRTLKKYRRKLKRRRLLFKHPTDDVWTPDGPRWASWVDKYVENTPTAEIVDVTEAYDMDIPQFEQYLHTDESGTEAKA